MVSIIYNVIDIAHGKELDVSIEFTLTYIESCTLKIRKTAKVAMDKAVLTIESHFQGFSFESETIELITVQWRLCIWSF